MKEWIGYRWLSQRYGVTPVQTFRTNSTIARSCSSVRADGYVHAYDPPAARPAPTLAGHLTFAFKHEGIHLEFLRACSTGRTSADKSAYQGRQDVRPRTQTRCAEPGVVLDHAAGQLPGI